MIQNCSAECPLECDSVDYSTSVTFSKFPASSYYYIIMKNSNYLARTYFNMSSRQFANAMVLKDAGMVPSTKEMANTMRGKLLKVNIFFEELMYTKLDESEKTGIVDLIGGLGGTLVS
jgi:hypothetical protein